jgi:hypothetical protein
LKAHLRQNRLEQIQSLNCCRGVLTRLSQLLNQLGLLRYPILHKTKVFKRGIQLFGHDIQLYCSQAGSWRCVVNATLNWQKHFRALIHVGVDVAAFIYREFASKAQHLSMAGCMPDV